jgi:hypothetical protein
MPKPSHQEKRKTKKRAPILNMKLEGGGERKCYTLELNIGEN